MTARDVMTRPAVSIGADTTVREAVSQLTQRSAAALPVVDEQGRVVGVFSEADAERVTMPAGDGADHRDGPVSAAMTRDVDVVDPGTPVATVAERMLTGRLGCLPVVEEGRLIGVIARRDLLHRLLRDDAVIASKVRTLLDGYGGRRRAWSVEVYGRAVVISGWFADEAERAAVAGLARAVPGVAGVELYLTTGLTVRSDD